MTTESEIDRDLPLDQLMQQWPVSIRVFIRRDIHCVGCTLAPFHSLRDAANLHGIDEDEVVREILELSR